MLGPRACFGLRLPAALIPKVLALAGKRLVIGGDALRVGVPHVQALRPAPVLAPRLVTTRNGQDEPRFDCEVTRQLRGLGNHCVCHPRPATGCSHQGQDRSRLRRPCGGIECRGIAAAAGARRGRPTQAGLWGVPADARDRETITRGFVHLLAKSTITPDRPPKHESLNGHILGVVGAARTLLQVVGHQSLNSLALSSTWFGVLELAVARGALLHDLGKANDQFQRMVRGDRSIQVLRHE